MYRKIIFILFSTAIVCIVGYLTYIYKSTGVPFYRHNEVYEIVHSDSSNGKEETIRNYTEPLKKYSLIDDEDELNRNYTSPLDFNKAEVDTLASENGLILK